MDAMLVIYLVCVIFIAAILAIMAGALWGIRACLQHEHRRSLLCSQQSTWREAWSILRWRLWR